MQQSWYAAAKRRVLYFCVIAVDVSRNAAIVSNDHALVTSVAIGANTSAGVGVEDVRPPVGAGKAPLARRQAIDLSAARICCIMLSWQDNQCDRYNDSSCYKKNDNNAEKDEDPRGHATTSSTASFRVFGRWRVE